MPLLDVQMRARELGRIRIGQVVTAKNGKTRPSKLDRFRITSHSRELIVKVAALYGGEATEWAPQGGGAPGWEVVTTSTRLPVLVPPQPISQWHEHWSGGGCLRRCDSVREVLTDSPCICGPDPADRLCKPTTRLNVVLREVEGLGVFRLETHGYYAAVELPSAADLLAASRGYIVGHLGLEERVVKRAGETRRFMVPTLDVDITPTQLMAGGAGAVPGAIAAAERPAPAAAAPAARPAGSSVLDVDSVRNAIAAAPDLDSLRTMWPAAREAGLLDEAIARATALGYTRDEPEPQSEGDAVAQMSPRRRPPPDNSGDPDELWVQIVRAVPEDWTSSQVEQDFAVFAGVTADQAGAMDMAAYLQHLTAAS